MVRSSISPTTGVQGLHTGTAPAAGCGHCLDGLTAADFDCLYALLMRLRQHIEAACEAVPDRCQDKAPADTPLVSLGPSGLGGPYQREM